MKEKALGREAYKRGTGLVGVYKEYSGERKFMFSLWPMIPDD